MHLSPTISNTSLGQQIATKAGCHEGDPFVSLWLEAPATTRGTEMS